MKKYQVVVNGETFEVEIEEVAGAPAVKAVSDEPKADPPQPKAPKPAARKPVLTGAAHEVTSPLPGVILNILAQEGQPVHSGDVVLVIEAMKMENEIVAPGNGTIQSLVAKKGDSIQAGDLLFVWG
ncbi:hypothetical protein DCMF_26045 [Candidatus Formimonas warabiya]|uniref:Lipoyl-binding domain-containing protein n=2 Tax=Formimonas warabiya TaxID=1761012 RepID=A0A3G1L2A8_FORW1|nr:hypothetical protein DCMF_26045 [Candidatus Formimonas warabiya]